MLPTSSKWSNSILLGIISGIVTPVIAGVLVLIIEYSMFLSKEEGKPVSYEKDPSTIVCILSETGNHTENISCGPLEAYLFKEAEWGFPSNGFSSDLGRPSVFPDYSENLLDPNWRKDYILQEPTNFKLLHNDLPSVSPDNAEGFSQSWKLPQLLLSSYLNDKAPETIQHGFATPYFLEEKGFLSTFKTSSSIFPDLVNSLARRKETRVSNLKGSVPSSFSSTLNFPYVEIQESGGSKPHSKILNPVEGSKQSHGQQAENFIKDDAGYQRTDNSEMGNSMEEEQSGFLNQDTPALLSDKPTLIVAVDRRHVSFVDEQEAGNPTSIPESQPLLASLLLSGYFILNKVSKN